MQCLSYTKAGTGCRKSVSAAHFSFLNMTNIGMLMLEPFGTTCTQQPAHAVPRGICIPCAAGTIAACLPLPMCARMRPTLRDCAHLAADRDVFVEVDTLVDRHCCDHPNRLLQHGVHVPNALSHTAT
jgi:hypothetical protein